MEKFKKQIENDIETNIAIDFDGVIHRNSKGFHDGPIYDKPVKGTKKSLKKLYNMGFNLIIFTCKARNDRVLINGKTAVEMIWEWLEKYELDKYILNITNEKPRALCYIDDKGIKFENWNQTIKILDNITIDI